MSIVVIDYDFSRETSAQSIQKLRGREVKGSLYFMGKITITIGEKSVSEVDRLYWFLSEVLKKVEDLVKGTSSRVTAGFWESVFYLGFSLEAGKLRVSADECIDNLWGTPEFYAFCDIASFVAAIKGTCNAALSHLDHINSSCADVHIKTSLYEELSKKCDNLENFIHSDFEGQLG